MTASLTIIKVKWWAMPVFQWHAFRSGTQAYRSPGLKSMKAWRHRGLYFCTLTTWENKDAMLAFRNNAAHLTAMKLTRKISTYADSFSWECASKPTMGEVQAKLQTQFSS